MAMASSPALLLTLPRRDREHTAASDTCPLTPWRGGGRPFFHDAAEGARRKSATDVFNPALFIACTFISLGLYTAIIVWPPDFMQMTSGSAPSRARREAYVREARSRMKVEVRRLWLAAEVRATLAQGRLRSVLQTAHDNVATLRTERMKLLAEAEVAKREREEMERMGDDRARRTRAERAALTLELEETNRQLDELAASGGATSATLRTPGGAPPPPQVALARQRRKRRDWGPGLGSLCFDCERAPSFNVTVCPEARERCWVACCQGCSHVLSPLPSQTEMEGIVYPLYEGASVASIFRARALDAWGGVRDAVVKFSNCIPGVQFRGTPFPFASRGATCMPQEIRSKTILNPVSVARIAEAGGLQTVSVRSWIEHVHSMLPHTNVIVSQEGLFAELAPGVPLMRYVDMSPKNVILERIARVPHELFRDFALLDLLTSQCDRHPGNVFVHATTGATGMTGIDTDQALGWNRCVVDSIFLPRTSYHFHFQNRPELSHFDYRCHVKGGAIGREYPPAFKALVHRLQRMMPDDIMAEFELMTIDAAEVLKTRAKHLHHLGFEEALERAMASVLLADEDDKTIVPLGGLRFRQKQHVIREPKCYAPGKAQSRN